MEKVAVVSAPFEASRQPCPFEICMEILSGAWTLRILWLLMDGAHHRFAEIERTIGPVSPKVLTERLRSLEKQHIVKRIIRKSATPHVEYVITDKGRRLEPVFRMMEQVSEQFVDENF
ncbi:helix-turn-helix transcriptional regulator [Burkholderia sp. Ac-20345]|uniref:winged helix-turn-helix transcriptional regulator n=1 Tax=Burkholderia sp. Ac-20345 TaxID=2703891 RepID=UPI00197BF330|nr:helix-turn-helix domain-containing protein [Burkholderia sp. Ac-20345]MBN3779629.1 helix-turn-helix transcriptional regulator [Burkholderia sp. Ac-20345]